jgi:hypothetical protein
MGAIFGQTVAGIAAIVVAGLLFARTSLNLWPVYALAGFGGAAGWVWLWTWMKGGRNITVQPSWPPRWRR